MESQPQNPEFRNDPEIFSPMYQLDESISNSRCAWLYFAIFLQL